MKKVQEALGAMLLGSVLILGMIFYSAFVWGFVVEKYYGWFVQSVLSLPGISYYQAIGISMFIGLFKNNHVRGVKDEYAESKTQHIVLTLLSPWLILLSGYIIHLIIN